MFFPSPLIAWCWIIFCFFWLFAFLWSKKAARRAPTKGRIQYIVLLLIGIVLVFNFSTVNSWYPLGITLIPQYKWIEALADILAVLGLALALWARIVLGSNWSGTVQVKEGHELITKGPYRYVRHPIYTALLLLFLATALAEGTLGSFIGLIFVFWSFRIKYPQEEQFMTEQFPDQYPHYRKKVKALLPYIY